MGHPWHVSRPTGSKVELAPILARMLDIVIVVAGEMA